MSSSIPGEGEKNPKVAKIIEFTETREYDIFCIRYSNDGAFVTIA
jgi:hypothetical protein